MGHTPFGYKIKNGIAVIDQPAADKLRQLYKNYLSGMSLSKAAATAGIKTYHGTAKRLMETVHYNIATSKVKYKSTTIVFLAIQRTQMEIWSLIQNRLKL